MNLDIKKKVDAVESETVFSVPNHLAVIMDGNSRWAEKENLSRSEGHRAGAESVRRLLKNCKTYGVEILTLFVFSSENWHRPQKEVRGLLALLVRYLRNDLPTLHEERVSIRFIGSRNRLSPGIRRLFSKVEAVTAENKGPRLILAVDYGGKWDITEAAKHFAERVADGSMSPEEINPELFDKQMSLDKLPVPDLCIRTGGDVRLSNFMLWQMAYTELYFCEVLWPDFDEHNLIKAFSDFSCRERRFGMRKSARMSISMEESRVPI
tara:strand:+ start:821 stop:1618 length:798 start_codon:yes stop_codon:yes gene_type:complete